MIEYTGKGAGIFTVRGKKTNQTYRFSASRGNNLKYVFDEDVPDLLRLPDFRLASVQREASPVAASLNPQSQEPVGGPAMLAPGPPSTSQPPTGSPTLSGQGVGEAPSPPIRTNLPWIKSMTYSTIRGEVSKWSREKIQEGLDLERSSDQARTTVVKLLVAALGENPDPE